jgi:uncharacterized protein with PQ loop repeat
MSSLETSTGIESFLVKILAPVLGVIMSEFLAFGPLPAMLHCRKAKSLGDVNPFLFPLLFGNGIGWVIYGSATRNPFVFLGNIGAVGLSLFYLLTAHTLTGCDSVRKQLEIMTLFLVTMWGTVGFIAAMLEDQVQGVAMIGILGNIIVFLMFASPLSTFPKVIKKKDSSSINRPFAICQVLNCMVWVLYGLATDDIYVTMPNVAGLILGFAQLFLILRYPAISCVVDVESRAPNYAAFDGSSTESEDHK